ncbi:MAG: single-stranded-DNA-specific exonuclease RecJ [Alphaproteobacteria bacterium]|nr:single-stranded-DNA-specific exonuclease RecJ [Alphaproteobacteria bacterium]
MNETTADLLNVSSSESGKKWVLRDYQEKDALLLSQRLGLPQVVARLLAARGFDPNSAASFLQPTLKETMPDPYILKDMEKAVLRIFEAVEKKQKIVIYGDYDVDGATSSALLFRYFAALGIVTRVYIPDRIDEGYGPNTLAFDQLKAEKTDLIITVDCGTTSFDPLSHAAAIGLDVIVIDHHAAEPKLPEAWAVVNPNRLDEPDNPLKELAAVGMSFLLAVALNRHLRQAGFFKETQEPDLRQLLDLVALGTVCDVMPLKGLNRSFVKLGLNIMASRNNVGLKVLSQVTKIDAKPSTYHLGYVLGPRINAGGRVGEAGLGSLLLRTENPMQAEEIAMRLNEYNQVRKEIEQDVLQAAFKQAETQISPVILTADRDWHPGVIGIVAGRLKEKYYRPSCVVSITEEGIGKGSARSIPGVDLGSIVHAAKQMGILIAGGGHAMAAGFTVEEKKIPEFHQFLNTRVEQSTQQDNVPKLYLDGVLNLNSLTPDLVRKIEAMEPFGSGNPAPKFALSNIHIFKVDIFAGEHIRILAGQLDRAKINAIAFRAVQTEMGQALIHHQGKPLHLAGSLKLDTWMGAEKVQFIIEDVATDNHHFAQAI